MASSSEQFNSIIDEVSGSFLSISEGCDDGWFSLSAT